MNNLSNLAGANEMNDQNKGWGDSFFTTDLKAIDPDLAASIQAERDRQQNQIEMIASENYTSPAVMRVQGSVMTNKYAEGYPGRRYYGGCEHVDTAEDLARERLKKLFDCDYVNVQPHSGAQANQAVMLSLLEPGDCFLGMSLDAGGHLTHGAKPNLSGKWFKAVQYGVTKDTNLIDFDEVEALAMEHKPKVIIAGGSAYPRIIDFQKFREIADKVGAIFWVDMAHFSGLVAGGAHPNPLDHAHVVTSTTHKTLRGPRGGIILSRDIELGKKINSAVFPGLQGGPLMHVIAAKAVAFKEALEPEFKLYAKRVVENAKALAEVIKQNGLDLVSGGTDTHLLLVDLRPKGVKGNDAEHILEMIGIACNKNGVPFDPEKPMVTSGIRLGTPAGTTRGFGVTEFQEIGKIICEAMDLLASGKREEGDYVALANRVKKLCDAYPIYPNLTEGF
jgi:glycine hydroxymethyltransferase